MYIIEINYRLYFLHTLMKMFVTLTVVNEIRRERYSTGGGKQWTAVNRWKWATLVDSVRQPVHSTCYLSVNCLWSDSSCLTGCLPTSQTSIAWYSTLMTYVTRQLVYEYAWRNDHCACSNPFLLLSRQSCEFSLSLRGFSDCQLVYFGSQPSTILTENLCALRMRTVLYIVLRATGSQTFK